MGVMSDKTKRLIATATRSNEVADELDADITAATESGGGGGGTGAAGATGADGATGAVGATGPDGATGADGSSAYAAGDGADWFGEAPTTIGAALDRIAAAVAGGLTGPIA